MAALNHVGIVLCPSCDISFPSIFSNLPASSTIDNVDVNHASAIAAETNIELDRFDVEIERIGEMLDELKRQGHQLFPSPSSPSICSLPINPLLPLPLLIIHLGHCTTSFNRPCTWDLFDWLLESSERWARLRFSGTEILISEWLPILVQLNKDQTERNCAFSNLQSLELGSDQYLEYGEDFNLDVFSRASNLEDLYLFCYNGSHVPSNWTQLQKVVLNSVDLTAIHELLCNCHNSLIVATVLPLDPMEPVQPFTPLILTLLKNLEFAVDSPESILLFDALTLPALKSLTITLGCLESNKLLELVTHSAFPLEKLEI
ncbi:hypothetical protein C8J56DRAFT_1037414 [Mycena floridula]|nr:hypothetical protein C8J56DRAFT_1037414 [Mycena floridula]